MIGPFSVALAVGIVAGLVFLALLLQVLVVGPSPWVDPVLQSAVAANRDPLGVRVARGIGEVTAYPSEVIAALVLAVVVTLRERASMNPRERASMTLRGRTLATVRSRVAGPLALTVAALLSLLMVPAVKALVGRTRPAPDMRARFAEDLGANTAFPSGHAASSAVFAGLVYLLIAPHLAGLGRRVLGVAAIGYAAAVGASRVYLGVHWFTDVLAGWALGAVIVAGLVILAHRSGQRPP